MTQSEATLFEALKYAKRFLNPKDVDMDFIDAALALAKSQPEVVPWDEDFVKGILGELVLETFGNFYEDKIDEAYKSLAKFAPVKPEGGLSIQVIFDTIRNQSWFRNSRICTHNDIYELAELLAKFTAHATVKEPQYPCDKCGKLRTKAEGGTTFTVCDECWDKREVKEPEQSEDIRKIINQCYEENQKRGFGSRKSPAEMDIIIAQAILNAGYRKGGGHDG